MEYVRNADTLAYEFATLEDGSYDLECFDRAAIYEDLPNHY